MFQELQELLPKVGDTLVLTISQGTENMTVTVMAKTNLEQNPRVTAEPLVLIATAEELDREFTRILQDFRPSHLSLMEALREAKTRIEQKPKAQAPKPQSKNQPASSKPLAHTGSSDTTVVTPATQPISQPGLF